MSVFLLRYTETIGDDKIRSVVSVCFSLLIGFIGLLLAGCSQSIPSEPFVVGVSASLADSYEWRSEEEREEQLRDWLVYAAVQALDFPLEDAMLALYDTPPMRRSQMAPASSYLFGEGRWVVLGEDLIVVVPVGAEEQFLDRLADEYRMKTTKKPARVYVFEYAVDDPVAMTATLFLRGRVSGEDFFRASHGYRELRIRKMTDLGTLLGDGFDLTYGAIESDGTLVVGGRRLKDGSVLNLDDVAVLYQANQHRLALSRELRDRYRRAEAWVKDLLGELEIGEEELDMALNPSLGFSLDPFDSWLYEDLLSPTPIGLYEERWKRICQAIGRGNVLRGVVETILFWEGPLDSLSELVDRISLSVLFFEPNSQCARYEGGIEGTRAAMTLYYCDLMAKLWAMDIESSTPTKIGMIPMPEVPVPSTYWEACWTYPDSRIWFGPRWEGLGHAPRVLFFGSLGVRIYAASSEYEGLVEEVEANPEITQVIEWWESHWSEIMAYEPQYQRLNQLMKWSTLIAWLEQSEALSFLNRRNADRNQEFASWFNEHRGELRFNGDLPFLDVNGAECLEQLCSKSYWSCGEEEAWLTGGVSPTSSEELEEVLEGGRLPSDTQHDVEEIRQSGEGQIEPLSGTKYAFDLAKGTIEATPSAPLSGIRFSGDWVEVDGAETLKVAFTQQSNGLSVALDLGDTSLGLFAITRQGQHLLVDYEPTAAVIAQDVVESLARGSTPESLQLTCPLLRQIAPRKDIQAAFELADGSVLIETKSGEWIRVGGDVDGSIRSGISDKESLEPHTFAANVIEKDAAERLLEREMIELKKLLARDVCPLLREGEAALVLSSNGAASVGSDGVVFGLPIDVESLRSQDEIVLAALVGDPSQLELELLQPAEEFLGLLAGLSREEIDTVFVGATEGLGLAAEYGAIDQYVKVTRLIDPESQWANIRVVYDQPMIEETVEGFEKALTPTPSSTAVLAHGCRDLAEFFGGLEEAGVTILLEPGPEDYVKVLGDSRYDYFIIIGPQPGATPLDEHPELLDSLASSHVAISFLIPHSWELTSNAIAYPQVELVLYMTGELRMTDAVEVAYRGLEAMATEGDVYDAAMEAWRETLAAHPEIEDWETILVEYLKVRAKG